MRQIVKIDIRLLTKDYIRSYSAFARKIISDISYYSLVARKGESKKFSIRNLKKLLADRNYLFFFCHYKGKIIAFLYGYFENQIFYMDWAGVEKRFRGQGILTAMVNSLEQKLKKKNVYKIVCDSRTNNKESIAFLRKLKYKKAALLARHWYGQDFYLWYKFIN